MSMKHLVERIRIISLDKVKDLHLAMMGYVVDIIQICKQIRIKSEKFPFYIRDGMEVITYANRFLILMDIF